MTVADAESVRWAALRLEVVVDESRAAAARMAGAFPRQWRGLAAYDCQTRIDQTAQRVRRVATAYEAAAEALLPYAGALADAQELTRRAESLLVEAADAQRREVGAGPHASEGLRIAAERLQAEAHELQRSAGARCAAALEAETAQAPDTSRWWSAQRFVEDAGHVVGGSVAGFASLLGSAWHALPGVGGGRSRTAARHELWADAKGAARVWEPPVETWHALHDGRYGLAAGTLAMTISPGKLGRYRLHDPHLAHREALREAWRRDLLAGVVIRRQTAEAMGVNGVSLINEEARGGHAVERHVGASDASLRHRNATGTDLAGTFAGLAQAEMLVSDVLRRNAVRLPEAYALQGRDTLVLVGRFPAPTGRVFMRGMTMPEVAYNVKVVIALEGGEPFVLTAYPHL